MVLFRFLSPVEKDVLAREEMATGLAVKLLGLGFRGLWVLGSGLRVFCYLQK